MTKTRSGDEEDNTSAYYAFELSSSNMLKERHGLDEVFKDAVFVGGGFMLPGDLAVEAYDELKIDVTDCIDFEIFPYQRIDEVNQMFANLGWEARKHLNPNGGRWPEIIKCYDLEKKEHSLEHEVMMLPRKSLAHLMFNT